MSNHNSQHNKENNNNEEEEKVNSIGISLLNSFQMQNNEFYEDFNQKLNPL